jgi:hypothetical protein
MKKRFIVAFVIAFIYLCIGWMDSWQMFFSTMLFDLFSLFFILFSEAAGDFKGLVGFFRPSRITQTSPGELVEFMGWVILLLPVVIYFLLLIG